MLLDELIARLPELNVLRHRMDDDFAVLGANGGVAWGMTTTAPDGQPTGGRLLVVIDLGVYEARWAPAGDPAADWPIDTLVLPWPEVNASIATHADSGEPGTPVVWTITIPGLNINETVTNDQDPAIVAFAAECLRRRNAIGR